MLRVGIIGTGTMGQNHVRVCSEISKVVGVCDISPEAAINIGKRFNVPHYTDARELLKQDLDAVIISTPTFTHHGLALDAISAGKHVLIEKPICNTIPQAKEVIAAAEKAGLTVAVGYIERHNPVVQSLKTALVNKQLGDVVTMAARRVSPNPPRIRDVGVVLDLASHDIDVIRYLAASEVESVYALGGKSGRTNHEDHANVLLHFKNGINGFLEVNWLTPMRVRKLFLTCSKGFVEADYIDQSVQISSYVPIDFDNSNLFQVPQEYDNRVIHLKKQEPLKMELRDFFDAILEKRKPLVTGMDGLRTLELAQAAVTSLETGKTVEMDN
jgi:UDP-N-acetylglucosamine 3-dehydrogenase